MADLATLRRRRGVAKASITRQTELEGATEEFTTNSNAQLLRKNSRRWMQSSRHIIWI